MPLQCALNRNAADFEVYIRPFESEGFTSYSVDFRLICTTNCSPVDSIDEGLLRDDLFYRISTIIIRVPPLRERGPADIRLLTKHFVKMYAQKYERPIAGVSQEGFQHLFAHTWPGNVRELQNVIERPYC